MTLGTKRSGTKLPIRYRRLSRRDSVMYVKDGIAYAGEGQRPIRVASVVATDNYRLLLTFTNGERRVFDCKPLFAYAVFAPLKNPELFRMAHVDHGTVIWNDDIDYAPETLYSDSIPHI
jgi:hypothetical protein